jgi:hypothetical protein
MKGGIVVIVLIVALASIAAVTFFLMAVDSESKGDTVSLESESVYLDPEEYNEYVVKSPKTLCIDPIAYFSGDGGIGFQTRVQFPTQGVEFRYLEMEWSFSDCIAPSQYYGSTFHYGKPGMSVSFEVTGDHGFLVRYDLPKHHVSSPYTHNFSDAIEFVADAGNGSISVTFRVGYASGGVVSEFVKTYDFTFPIPSEASDMQRFLFLLSGPPSSSDRNQLLYSWPIIPIAEPMQQSYVLPAGVDSIRIVPFQPN